MADNNEEVLRKSLDAVDRHRNRLLMGLAALVAVLILMFVFGADRLHRHGINDVLHVMFVFLLFWTTGLALVIVIQITVMTKRILRAIELSSKR